MTVDTARPTIVVGLHDVDTGRPVLTQAMDLASRLGGQLVVAHVEEMPISADVGLPASGMAGPPVVPTAVDAPTPVEGAAANDDRWLRDLQADIARDLDLESVPCAYRRGVGDPGHALAELAAETDAYCVVVGSRGEGFLASVGRFFRPSVSRSVLQERRTPVLVVPSTFDGGSD